MVHFEKYHPIMTPSFTFDWLTTVKLKSIFQLRQMTDDDMTPLDTANYVNETMRIMFHNQQLVWGVTDTTSHTFVGIATIDQLQPDQQQARLSISLLPQFQHPHVVEELFTKLRDFASLELNIQKLLVETCEPLQQTVLKGLGFTEDQPNQLTFQQPKD